MFKNEIIKILENLVAFRSVSPQDDGAIDYCMNFLQNLGFSCKKLSFGGVNNLYARIGNAPKNLCFAGHVDVVPPLHGWSTDPFTLTLKNNELAFGRGVNDMKGPLAACLSAISDVVSQKQLPLDDISLSIMLTSDEEIMGVNGTQSVVKFLKDCGEKITGCVLCESCSPDGDNSTGEYIKIGCRGSLNIDITSRGPQCHVATAKSVGNHLHAFVTMINNLCNTKLDDGNEMFAASSIQLTSLDTSNNKVRNIVPPFAQALLNVRFNNIWTLDTIEQHITKFVQAHDGNFEITYQRFGNSFIGSSDKFIEKLKLIIENTSQIQRSISAGTDGGNSDALFIRELCDVVEIGSQICNAHIVDEYIKISELEKLYAIYKEIILKF